MTRASPWTIALLSTIIVVLFAPVIILMLAAGNDYLGHILSAATWEQTGHLDRPRPQFLYHLLLIGIHRLIPGLSYAVAASILALACYLFLGLTIYLLLHRHIQGIPMRRRWLAAVPMALVLMLVAPASLFTLGSHNLYWGYLAVHTYHNPTIILLEPLALVTFLFAVRVFTQQSANPKTVFLSGILAALGTIAKPSLAICLLPALAIMTAYTLYRRRPVDWGLLLIGIVIPIVEVLVWQYFYYKATGMGGFAFAPLQVMQTYSPDGLLLPKFFLSILFPLCVFALYFEAARKDTSLQLAWLSFAFGALYSYLLIEAHDWLDANFLWSGQVSLLILFITSTLFLLRQPLPTAKFRLSAAVLALHFASGIVFYLSNLHPDWRTWL